MFHQSVSFYNPWFLLLLGLVPLVAVWSYDSLAGLGKWRRWIAILLRSSVMVLLIFALADLQRLRADSVVSDTAALDYPNTHVHFVGGRPRVWVEHSVLGDGNLFPHHHVGGSAAH